MFVKQLSVFIENREGRLEQVTEVLKEQDINIIRFKPFQAFIRRPEDMFFGKIIAGTRMYGTFGLKYHLLS